LHRICIGEECVVVETNEYHKCLGHGIFEYSVALSCLAAGIDSRGVRELIRNMLNDYYALCGSLNDYLAVRAGVLELLVPRGCSVEDVSYDDVIVRIRTSCGLAATCRFLKSG